MKRSTFSGRFIADAIIEQLELVNELRKAIDELDEYTHSSAISLLATNLKKEKETLQELEDKIYEEVRN